MSQVLSRYEFKSGNVCGKVLYTCEALTYAVAAGRARAAGVNPDRVAVSIRVHEEGEQR